MGRSALIAAVAAGACVLGLTGCGAHPAARPSAAASHRARASAAPSATASAATFALIDQAVKVKCPPGSPRAAQCFRITLTGTLGGYGRLRSGGWLDVEVPQSSPACGRPWTYTERLSTATGSLVARATGPRLCLDMVITVRRHYTVARATGSLRRLHGAGTITLNVLSVGAAETWTLPR